MELAKAAFTSFVLIDADWPGERARRLIERLDPSHVIVWRAGHRRPLSAYERQGGEPTCGGCGFDSGR